MPLSHDPWTPDYLSNTIDGMTRRLGKVLLALILVMLLTAANARPPVDLEVGLNVTEGSPFTVYVAAQQSYSIEDFGVGQVWLIPQIGGNIDPIGQSLTRAHATLEVLTDTDWLGVGVNGGYRYDQRGIHGFDANLFLRVSF